MSQSELRGLESGSRAPPWEMGCNSGLGGRRLASFPDWPRHFSPVSESRRGQDHCQSWRTRSNLCWGWSPGEALSTPYSRPSARRQPTHPILAEVVSLHAGPLEAEAALAAARAVCPGEVARLAHHLALGLARAPQLGAGLHVGAGLGAHTKGQLTLLAQRVAGARQVLGQGDGLAGLVQEAVSCGSRGCSSGTGPERRPWPAWGLEGRERTKPGTRNGPRQSPAPWVASAVGNRRQMGRAAHLPRPRSPWPLSRKSVTTAALQADQGLARSIWMSVGDIMWLPRSFPNTSSHTFTLSWGMLNTWPAGEKRGLRGWPGHRGPMQQAHPEEGATAKGPRKKKTNAHPCSEQPAHTQRERKGALPSRPPPREPCIPSSWAVVKAEGSPSSSITEQLLLGSHMVPTSAMPRVSQVVAPHRSCRGRGEAEASRS